MKTFALILLFLLLFFYGYTQQGKVSGQLKPSDENVLPDTDAIISLLKVNDSLALRSTAVNKDGAFVFNMVLPGSTG